MESVVAHRKIELQSADDFTYLIGNVRQAAEDSLNAAFPPVDSADGQGDELRTQIEQLVNEYINRTFAMAAPNLTINGLPVSDASPYLSPPGAGPGTSTRSGPEEQHEPFDGRKRARVEELAREEEDLLREIASLKRRVPAAAAAAYAEQVRAGVAADEAAAAQRVAAAAAAEEAPRKGKRMLAGAGEPLERQADVEGAFRGAVETLARIKREMPAAVARMERARVAGEYVVTER